MSLYKEYQEMPQISLSPQKVLFGLQVNRVISFRLDSHFYTDCVAAARQVAFQNLPGISHAYMRLRAYSTSTMSTICQLLDSAAYLRQSKPSLTKNEENRTKYKTCTRCGAGMSPHAKMGERVFCVGKTKGQSSNRRSIGQGG
jgi:hypothetical protein